MSLESINPATLEAIKSYVRMSPEEIEHVLNLVAQDHARWRRTGLKERAALLDRAADLLLARKDFLARLMALEMGKPLLQGRAEIEKCALGCRYYAQQAEEFLAPQTVLTDALKSYVLFEPLGPVLAIMPWNFPFWQVYRFAAPALMAGNACVLKHAANVTGCALAIEDLMREAGYPANLFRALIIDNQQAASVIAHPVIRAVTLTGSTRAGQSVASQAGRHLKKTVLELGGSDAFVVLDDADLDFAVSVAVKSRMVNGGQSCIAAKRFIIAEAVCGEFEKKFVDGMRAIRMGDPLDEATELGPLARLDLRDELHRQVQSSLKGGARLLLGGEIPDRKGAYYPPTVLTGVKKGQTAYEEEIFGPVASIICVRDGAQAIAVANDSQYGLGFTLFSSDLEKAEKIAAGEIEAGSCFINSMVQSDPRLPFGGVKNSGYGRELSHFGMHEFVNIKTVYVGRAGESAKPHSE